MLRRNENRWVYCTTMNYYYYYYYVVVVFDSGEWLFA